MYRGNAHLLHLNSGPRYIMSVDVTKLWLALSKKEKTYKLFYGKFGPCRSSIFRPIVDPIFRRL